MGTDIFQVTTPGTQLWLHGIGFYWASATSTGTAINTIGTTARMCVYSDFDSLSFNNVQTTKFAINAVNWLFGRWGNIFSTMGAIQLLENDATNNYGNIQIAHIHASNLIINGSTHSAGENLINISECELYPEAVGTYGLVLENCNTVYIGQLDIEGGTNQNAILYTQAKNITISLATLGAGAPVITCTGGSGNYFNYIGSGTYGWNVSGATDGTLQIAYVSGVNRQGFGQPRAGDRGDRRLRAEHLSVAVCAST